MAKTYFPTVGKIPFEGPESKNPLAFHYYEPDRVTILSKAVVGGKLLTFLRE